MIYYSITPKAELTDLEKVNFKNNETIQTFSVHIQIKYQMSD